MSRRRKKDREWLFVKGREKKKKRTFLGTWSLRKKKEKKKRIFLGTWFLRKGKEKIHL